MTGIESYKGFLNILFGVLFAILGYLVTKELSNINDSLISLQSSMQQQLLLNVKTDYRLQMIEHNLEEHIKATVKK